MLVMVNGTSLPGTRFERRAGICVGLRVGDEITDPVAADALDVHWMTEVRVRALEDGYDYLGPAIRGRRGERCLGLAWVDETGEIFRALKIPLRGIPPHLVHDALDDGNVPITAAIRLTDDNGGPLCATIPKDRIEWALGPRA